MFQMQLLEIPIGPLRGFCFLGLQCGKEPSDAPSIFTNFLSGAIGLLTVIAAIWFTFNFLIGAIGIISAGGDKAKVESSRARITTGVIGIVVVISSLFVIQLLGSLVGLGNIILNPTELLNQIQQ